MNCKKRFLGLVLSMTTLVGTLALTTNASDSVKSAVGIVDASALRLREGPGTDTEILTTAYRNDYVVILESEGDWYKVIYNLREGYMHSDYLTVKERENVELGYGEVNTYLVNLRSGPTTSSEILDQLAEGEDAYIIGSRSRSTWVIFTPSLRRTSAVDLEISIRSRTDLTMVLGTMPWASL